MNLRLLSTVRNIFILEKRRYDFFAEFKTNSVKRSKEKSFTLIGKLIYIERIWVGC